MNKTIHGNYLVPLDGLRALAVLLILLFHLDIEMFSGGFSGVDVFFVISGFLITKNILSDLENNNFSFIDFYARRIARLLPALFITITITLILSVLVLAPEDLVSLGHASVSSVLISSNVYFWLHSGYFDALSAFKPLLHTWSLGAEEQFYLFWPLLIWFVIVKTTKMQRYFIIATLGILSLFSALSLVNEYPNLVFYLTPFRVYQFVLGAFVAFIGVAPKNNSISIINIFSIFILLLTVIHNKNTNHDVIFSAFIPAVATSLIIFSCNSLFSQLFLGSKIAVWIGKRSYSIYLVHWPLIVLWKLYTDYSLSNFEKLIFFILSICFGALLFEFVEQKFRFKKDEVTNLKSNAFIISGVLCLIIFIFSSSYWVFSGFPQRIPEDIRQYTELKPLWSHRLQALRIGKCHLRYHRSYPDQYDWSLCSNPPKNKKSYFIIGDSYAADTYLVMSQAYPDIYFGQLTIPGCQLRMPVRIKNNKQCKILYELAFKKLVNNQSYSGIILSSKWPINQYNKIDEMIEYFKKNSMDIILIGQHIRFVNRLPNIIASSVSKKSATNKARSLILEEMFKENENISSYFGPKVKFIDFIQLQCPQKCDIFDSAGNILYLDHSHLSMEGVRLLAERMKSRYPNIQSGF